MEDKVNIVSSLGMDMPSEEEDLAKQGKELLEKHSQEEIDRMDLEIMYAQGREAQASMGKSLEKIVGLDTQQPGIVAQFMGRLEKPSVVSAASPKSEPAPIVQAPAVQPVQQAPQGAVVINTDNIDMKGYYRNVRKKSDSVNSQDMHKLRKADAKPKLFMHHGKYGVDRQLARRAFEARTIAKPKWAVVGCVWLRAGGLCEVCTETIDMNAVVRQLQLHKSGGSFSELNCLLVCRYCDKVWPVRTMFDTGVNALTLADLTCVILAKRNKGAQGSKYLTDKAHSHWHRQRALQERLVIALNTELDGIMSGPVKKPTEDTSDSCLLV